tara:strand:+ start:1492 stop:2406 length:915 start_codon:yes stop_codon:yes gene_type:complete
MTDKIFVSMPAWEDTTILETIDKLLASASKPDNIVFGFGFNYSGEEPDLSTLKNKYYVLRDKEDYGDNKSPGIIQVRNAIRRLMTDEAYYMSIDAHANFDQGWDSQLIRDIKYLTVNGEKCIISKQLLQPEERRNHRTEWFLMQDGTPNGRPAPDFNFYGVRDKMVRENYFLNYYTSGNFIFAKADWATGIDFPDFHGFPYEEPELSLVTFCNGFDVVSPTGAVCPVHAGNDPKYIFPYDERYWELKGPDRNNPQHWEKIWVFDDGPMIMEARKLLLEGENKYFSLHGLERSVSEFYDTIGLNK